MKHTEKKRGLKALYCATANSLSGIIWAARTQRAFMQELLFAIFLVPVAYFLDIGVVHKFLLIGSIVGVLVVELLNSAIEGVVDYISVDYDERARRVKDMASGAVFMSILLAMVIWGWTIVLLVF